MRRLRFVVVVVFAAVLCSSIAAAEDPLKITLTLEPAQTVPGLPVAFRIRIENLSSDSLKIARNVSLEVVDLASNTFKPGWGPGMDAPNTGGFPGDEWTVVVPGTPVDVAIPLKIDLSSPGWFFDRRLSIPGRYTLTVGLEYVSMSEEREGSVISSPAVLEIRKPRGADARVWSFMTRLANRDMWSSSDWITHGFTVANHVWRYYPDSHYLPYVAGYIPEENSDQKIQILRRALEIDPDGPMADVLLMSIAALFEQSALRFASVQHDLKESLNRSRLARETLQLVIKRGKPAYSTLARRHLERIFDDDQSAQWSSPNPRQ